MDGELHYSKKQSLEMGKRIKTERERHGFSHVELSDMIYVMYGVRISKDSLINYEVSDESHAKSLKNNGMRVEYLRYLAGVFGVTTDWLCAMPGAIRFSDGRQGAYVERLEKQVETMRRLLREMTELLKNG